MLILLNEPANRHVAVNPENVVYVAYNVPDANKRPVSRIILNIQNSDGFPKDLLVLETVKEILKTLNGLGEN